MRFALSTLLAAALALPVLAQPPGRGGDRERPSPQDEQRAVIEKLTNRIKELEQKLNESNKKKDEKKEEKEDDKKEMKKGEKKEEKKEEKKPEPRREGDRKPADVQPQPFPPRDGRAPQPGRGDEPRPQFGGGSGGPQGGNQFNPMGGPPREGQGRPMAGMGGGGMGMGMSGGGGMMSPNSFPGMDALTKDEQEMFQKLMTKMRTAGGKPAPQADRKPNVEERLERLEGMMQKLMQQKLDR